MNLGALIKAQGSIGLLGCCGLSGFWHLAGATFSLDCHVFLSPQSAFVALSPGVCGFQFSLAEESVSVLWRVPVGRGWS